MLWIEVRNWKTGAGVKDDEFGGNWSDHFVRWKLKNSISGRFHVAKKENMIEYEESVVPEGYSEILRDIRGLLSKAQYQAYKSIDNIRVQAYWQVGERIARGELEHKERADYGKRLIERLAEDLGFHKRDLYRMVQFYRTYPIVTSLLSQLSWTHYTVLMKIDNETKRRFYEIQTAKNSWSTRKLEKEIRKRLYEDVKKEGKLIVSVPQLLKSVEPEEAFKDAYNFEFLIMDDNYKETELEKALIFHVEQLLLEFGADFSLSGRQRPIVIDGEYHSVDLEFYHRGIPCIVLVDLKIGKFKAEYVGQMNKYLNYYRENRKYEWEKDPVGLIICEHKGNEEVRYALGGLKRKIFVAEYKVKLPSEEQIKEKLKTMK